MGATKFMNCDDGEGSQMEDCKLKQPKNVKFFSGQLLNVTDFELEKNYFNEKRHLLNRVIHGSGIICGLEVKNVELATENCICGPDGNMETISRWIADISAGVALDCLGREIIVAKSDRYVVSEKDPHQLSNYFGLFIKRKDLLTNPVPSVHVTSCEDTCCYSRITEDFELVFDSLDQSVQIFFDSTTYTKSDQIIVYLVKPFNEQVHEENASLIFPSPSGEINKPVVLTLEKTLAGMNIFSCAVNQLQLLEGSKIAVEHKTKDEEGEEKIYTSSAYISGSPSGKTSEVIEKKRLCEDYYKVWLKECMCCDDPTDAKVLLSVLMFSKEPGKENKVIILDEETTLFRSLVPNLKKLLDLISKKQQRPIEPDEKISVNSGIVEFKELEGNSFRLETVNHKLILAVDSPPPFVLVGILHEDHQDGDAMIKYMDEMILPELCASKFNTSIFGMTATPQDKDALTNLSDNQQSRNFFLMVKAFRITRSDFILGAFNFRKEGSKTFKAIWYAGSSVVPSVGDTVRVPFVVGKSIELAEKDIGDNGLIPIITDGPDSKATVVSQIPAGGDPAKKGDQVSLTTVSDVAKVPFVLELDWRLARDDIISSELTPTFNEATFEGAKILFQSPNGGVERPKHTEVFLTLGVQVPNVLGKEEDPARTTVEAGGRLQVHVDGLRGPGQVVVVENPKELTVVPKNILVTLTMGNPPTPNVTSRQANTSQYGKTRRRRTPGKAQQP